MSTYPYTMYKNSAPFAQQSSAGRYMAPSSADVSPDTTPPNGYNTRDPMGGSNTQRVGRSILRGPTERRYSQSPRRFGAGDDQSIGAQSPHYGGRLSPTRRRRRMSVSFVDDDPMALVDPPRAQDATFVPHAASVQQLQQPVDVTIVRRQSAPPAAAPHPAVVDFAQPQPPRVSMTPVPATKRPKTKKAPPVPTSRPFRWLQRLGRGNKSPRRGGRGRSFSPTRGGGTPRQWARTLF